MIACVTETKVNHEWGTDPECPQCRKKRDLSRIAERLESLCKRIEAESQWVPQAETSGHLRVYIIQALKTLALSMRTGQL